MPSVGDYNTSYIDTVLWLVCHMMIVFLTVMPSKQGSTSPVATFQLHGISVVVETVSETSHLCWNQVQVIIESTYLTLNMKKIWGCFKVQVGWKIAFYRKCYCIISGKTPKLGLEKVSARPWPLKKKIALLTFTLSVNKIIFH